jgi:peptidoglycan/LPS O-acetylase OafA/YrhL
MSTESGAVPALGSASGRPTASFRRLPSLTGLRVLAISVVFVSHAALFSGMKTGGNYSALYPLGALGVSLFFILSGFVMAYSARDTDTARAFWRRRFFKIYPSHVVAWIVVMLFIWVGGVPRVPPNPNLPLSHDLTNLFLVQTIIPWKFTVDGGNGVAWSLVCEMVFYLLFPVLFPVIRRIPARRLVLATVVAVAAVWLVPLICISLSGTPTGSPIGPDLSMNQLAYGYFWPVSRLPEFILGMVLARLAVYRPVSRVGIIPSIILVPVFMEVGKYLLPQVFLLTAVTAIPLALLIRATASVDISGKISLLRLPFMVFLGNVSYAFYLLHYTTFMVVYHYLGKYWSDPILVIATFAIAQVTATLLYSLIERPFMRRFSTAHRRTSLPPSTSVLVQESEVGARGVEADEDRRKPDPPDAVPSAR